MPEAVLAPPTVTGSRDDRAPPHAALAVVTRGDGVDAVHYGSVAVVDRSGRLLHAAGDPEFPTMTRSTLKPFQAIPFVAAGGAERFGFAPPELALLCASHSGEPRHVEAVGRMLARCGLGGDDLQCGTHAPGYYEVRGELPPPPPYSPLAHNCSGKHAGMLAYCVACGLPTAGYLEADHPLQRAIRAVVARFTGMDEGQLVAGVDGCSAPNYGVPLSRLALAYARLASDRGDGEFGAAPRRLADAMVAYPEMVSGEGRNDLAYMQAGRGDWVTKIGAEGVQAIGIRGAGIGIAVKVVDGARRALHPATVEVLDQLGLLDAAARAALAQWREPTVRNVRGLATGRVRPTVVVDSMTAVAQPRRGAAGATSAA
jgi:L-asparaginase II